MTPGRNQQSGAGGHAVRRQHPRDRRRLFLRLAVVLVVFTCLGGGVWWLGHSPVFALKNVDSGGYRYTDQQELERIFGSFLGQNIWTVRQEAVRDSLAGLPWVKELKIHRRLPGSLVVDFSEARPVLALEPERGQPMQVVVEDGRVLPFPAHLDPPALPVLVGVPTEADTTGGGGLLLTGEHLANVLSLQAAMESSGLETACPVDFVVARDAGYVIVLQNDQGSLLVGREQFAERLDRYMSARDHLDKGLQMDLRFADRITCRRI